MTIQDLPSSACANIGCNNWGWKQIQEFFGAPPSTHICADCIKDTFLKSEIQKHLVATKCDYCGKNALEKIAAPVSAILEPIAVALCKYYTLSCAAGNEHDLFGLPRTERTESALSALPLKCQQDFFREVLTYFGPDEVWDEETKGFSHFGKSMLFSWATFSNLVKHQQRFFLSTPLSRCRFDFDLPPVEMFEKLGQVVTEMNLHQTWQKGETLYRVRARGNNATWLLDATELGPPPNNKAGAQRMSPAGISYFYLAKDRETALAEVIGKPPCRLAIGRFSLHRSLCLLDLTQLPSVSVFDDKHRLKYDAYCFLSEFALLISQPVEKDGREHIEYVPTQVLSEYFAKIYKQPDGNPLDGMVYFSAAREAGVNIVLFPPKPGKKGFMELVDFEGAEEVTFQNWTEFCRKINQPSIGTGTL